MDSQHGFFFVEELSVDATRVDFFLPWSMLHKLQLRAGSIVLVQGFDQNTLKELHMKPAKARLFASDDEADPDRSQDDDSVGSIPFVATIRFPDTPKTLHTFLEAATESEVSFVSIRTSGVRQHALSDVLCEGTIATSLDSIGDFSESSAIDRHLQAFAAKAGGIVIDSHKIIHSQGHREWGEVLSSEYFVDLPLLRGSYGKIRLDLKPLLAPTGPTPQLVTVLLNPKMMTLTVDLEFATKHAYLFSFDAPDLIPDAPVTRTLLQTVADQDNALNVDALDAFEYRKWDPNFQVSLGDQTIRSTGVIEALLTKSGDFPPIDPTALESAIKARIQDFSTQGDLREDPTVRVVDVSQRLEDFQRNHLRAKGPPEDSDFVGFEKQLNHGRYAFLETIGQGAFGNVNKYLDLRTRQVVAAKHITDRKRFKRAEVNALTALADEHAVDPHLAKVLDHFDDGSRPVIVLEYVPHVLENHEFNRTAEFPERRHRRPGTFLEFLGMAEQLLAGLSWLHSGGAKRSGEKVIHADIKPANIGFTLPVGGILWKLLDLGLASQLPVGKNLTEKFVAAGTLPFMSPQALEGRPLPGNDIYSLGVVLFMVWNDWGHPSGETEETLKRQPSLVLRTYAETVAQEAQTGGVFQEFDPDMWTMRSPFGEDIPENLLRQLRSIVYKMLRVSAADRYQVATDTVEDFRLLREAATPYAAGPTQN